MSEPTVERGAVAKLEFPLPEENNTFLMAAQAGELWMTVWELDQRLRNFLKHDDITGRTAAELAEEVRKDLAPMIEKFS